MVQTSLNALFNDTADNVRGKMIATIYCIRLRECIPGLLRMFPGTGYD